MSASRYVLARQLSFHASRSTFSLCQRYSINIKFASCRIELTGLLNGRVDTRSTCPSVRPSVRLSVYLSVSLVARSQLGLRHFGTKQCFFVLVDEKHCLVPIDVGDLTVILPPETITKSGLDENKFVFVRTTTIMTKIRQLSSTKRKLKMSAASTKIKQVTKTLATSRITADIKQVYISTYNRNI